mmetsp:Transcript_166972/g.536065  ORF Transcript_166972/g.536065 Transcript_166972/m.536065 type:complete len:140 (-) Transcript_166972:4429-4848(-)
MATIRCTIMNDQLRDRQTCANVCPSHHVDPRRAGVMDSPTPDTCAGLEITIRLRHHALYEELGDPSWASHSNSRADFGMALTHIAALGSPSGSSGSGKGSDESPASSPPYFDDQLRKCVMTNRFWARVTATCANRLSSS